ncbi:hypothetical protein Daesc_002392 [Daldinia eschscholtzii]|uniref:Uncharacterized protein n=1 Tax=Daldinia eschscholtzii TaxID=292717 RepID=A0AAX6MXH7_9PEZI
MGDQIFGTGQPAGVTPPRNQSVEAPRDVSHVSRADYRGETMTAKEVFINIRSIGQVNFNYGVPHSEPYETSELPDVFDVPELPESPAQRDDSVFKDVKPEPTSYVDQPIRWSVPAREVLPLIPPITPQTGKLPPVTPPPQTPVQPPNRQGGNGGDPQVPLPPRKIVFPQVYPPQTPPTPTPAGRNTIPKWATGPVSPLFPSTPSPGPGPHVLPTGNTPAQNPTGNLGGIPVWAATPAQWGAK